MGSNIKHLDDDEQAVKQDRCELARRFGKGFETFVSFPEDQFLAMHERSSEKIVVAECPEEECLQAACRFLMKGAKG
jgi:hypothetical protein